MIEVSKKNFLQAAKSKIILVFLLVCFSLFLAWMTTRVAFKEILQTVETIAAPNTPLRIAKELSSRMVLPSNPVNLSVEEQQFAFIRYGKKTNNLLDTLAVLYASNPIQQKRVQSLKKLLLVRDRQFIEYLKVKESLVNNESLNEQVQNLGDLVNRKVRRADSTVLTTEYKTETTTLATDETKVRGLLSKIFGKKRPEQYKIINEEIKVKRDTIGSAAEDSVALNMQYTLQKIEQEQHQKTNEFIDREVVLSAANAKLTSEILKIINAIEIDAVSQINANSVIAQRLVNEGVSQITLILISFFGLTLILLFFIFYDITRSNKYRRDLEVAKAEADYHGLAKQRFLSNMSHEIRTPLQSILGYSEQMLLNNAVATKEVTAIHTSSQHLLQIVNEILDYNRIISGEFSFNEVTFELRAVLEAVETIVKPLAQAKGIDFVTSMDVKEKIYVKGDPFRLKQILLNLVGNAIKFTHTGEVSLIFNCKLQESLLHLSILVKDTGIGFDASKIDRIFKEFEQLPPDQLTLNQNGTGLGLAIVKSLLDRQGGRIYVKSEPNVGSEFSVFLKFELSETVVERSNPVDTQIETSFKGKIWVVDDDQLILDLCALIFQRSGIEFRLYNNGYGILDASWDPEVSVLLLDLRLPDISGVDLLKRLKKSIPPHVKVYAITAQVLPDEQEGLLLLGFDNILMKPFTERDLLDLLGKENPLLVVDFTALKEMTFGEEVLFKNIIKRFLTDSSEDKMLIEAAIAQEDFETATLIVHRIGGRLAQIGASNLGMYFKNLEQKLRTEQALNTELKKLVQDGLANLSKLVEQLTP